jgi:hypothetical protein
MVAQKIQDIEQALGGAVDAILRNRIVPKDILTLRIRNK